MSKKANNQASELKYLRQKQKKYEAQIKDLTSQLKVLQNEHTQAIDNLQTINEQIETFTLLPTVTEHAVLRYLERVDNVDVKSVIGKILNPEFLALVNKGQITDGRVPVIPGFRAVIKNNFIVTIAPK